MDITTGNNSWSFVVDRNEDGRKDLLVGQEGIGAPCNVYVYLNQGTSAEPVFGDSTPVLAAGSAFRNCRCVPTTADLDRDGAKDLVLGEWYSSIRWYRNTGVNSDPRFDTFENLAPPDPDSFRNGIPPRIAFCDWDGDTDLDMVTCDYYGWVTLRENVTPTGVSGPVTGRSPGPIVPTVVRRGPIVVPGATRVEITDPCGRRVTNDRALAPGAYFVRVGSAKPVRLVVTH